MINNFEDDTNDNKINEFQNSKKKKLRILLKAKIHKNLFNRWICLLEIKELIELM